MLGPAPEVCWAQKTEQDLRSDKVGSPFYDTMEKENYHERATTIRRNVQSKGCP